MRRRRRSRRPPLPRVRATTRSARSGRRRGSPTRASSARPAAPTFPGRSARRRRRARSTRRARAGPPSRPASRCRRPRPRHRATRSRSPPPPRRSPATRRRPAARSRATARFAPSRSCEQPTFGCDHRAVADAFIPSPPSNGLHLGPFFFHAYGLAYVAAVIAAVAITSRRWRAVGGDPKLVQEVALWAFPAGLIGGRLYFLATSWNEVPPHWWGPFAIWRGGLGIWGGIAAGTLVGIWVLHRRRADIPVFLDAAAPALLVAQAIGRVGNYFNQELFGGPTTLPWGLEIDPAHRPARYASYATFHPTFLYEIVWNLLLAFAPARSSCESTPLTTSSAYG
ncbi:MAG: hypothetical protein E6G41_10405 [Actinobacteria bacterium]|nr:MAG: hypothetical protein E6G41_10405 [Actinomycetota bacterium]